MAIQSSSMAAFACYVKACAPPPVGKGGSSKAAVQARQLAKRIVGNALAAEKAATSDLRDVIEGSGGQMVGLEHRVKGLTSLTRKIHDKAITRGQSLEESASKISDALRYTAVLDAKDYTKGVKATLKSLRKKGYEVDELETHWQRGDAYNGVHAIIRHPNGTKLEVQFHTPESLEAKGKTHVIYEKARQADTTPQERTRLTQMMIQIADAARIPTGAQSLGVQVFRPA